MVNTDRLQGAYQQALRELAESEKAALSASRDPAQPFRAEMADIDARFATEQVNVLAGKIQRLRERAPEIDAFEQATGVEWDAWHWELPVSDLIAWWITIQERAA